MCVWSILNRNLQDENIACSVLCRRRKSSTSSTQMNVLENEHGRADVAAQTVEAITLSSVPQQRRLREYHEIRTIDNSQQVDDVSTHPFVFVLLFIPTPSASLFCQHLTRLNLGGNELSFHLVCID